jgi:hypothetical protein
MTINFDIDGKAPFGMSGNEASMKETATASLHFTSAFDLDELKKEYQLFEDLLILLTSTDFSLDWPSVQQNGNSRCRVYFRKVGDHTVGTAPRFFQCVTSFTKIRGTFGTIWNTWRSKGEELGPALYLYLGTRRGIPLYVEHRFVNLIWGIEAFHRKKFSVSLTSRLNEKIQRILGEITRQKDKKWLAKKLENAHEPSLAERIDETISTVPLGLDAARLRTFSDRCAKLRNDISHFGGLRDGLSSVSYEKFALELHTKSEVLSTLY